MKKQILLVEDDHDIAKLIRLHVADLGHDIHHYHDGLQGLQAYQQQRFDLVLLDIMLPGLDGLEICKHIRNSSKPYTPILMLTSKSSELDRVLGLELGADDYLTKPFSVMELMARIKAQLRRSEHAANRSNTTQSSCLEFVGLSLDSTTRSVIRDGETLELTAKEFDLLMFFAQHPGQVFNRLQLLDRVWGYSHEGYEHTVNSHINRLRSKLEPHPRNPRFIKTIWGVGYQFIGKAQ